MTDIKINTTTADRLRQIKRQQELLNNQSSEILRTLLENEGIVINEYDINYDYEQGVIKMKEKVKPKKDDQLKPELVKNGKS